MTHILPVAEQENVSDGEAQEEVEVEGEMESLDSGSDLEIFGCTVGNNFAGFKDDIKRMVRYLRQYPRMDYEKIKTTLEKYCVNMTKSPSFENINERLGLCQGMKASICNYGRTHPS